MYRIDARFLRLAPLFGLIGFLILVARMDHRLPAQNVDAWRAGADSARALGQLLTRDYPSALGQSSREEREEIEAALDDFGDAGQKRWQTSVERDSLARQELRRRLGEADEVSAKATQRMAAALKRVPNQVEITGEQPVSATRSMKMPFRSGVLLVRREQSPEAVPAFLSRKVDLSSGKSSRIEIPERPNFFLALELISAPLGSKQFSLDVVSETNKILAVDLSTTVPPQFPLHVEISEGDAPTEAAVGLYSTNGHFLVADDALNFSEAGYVYAPTSYRSVSNARHWPGKPGFQRCFFVKGGFSIDLPAGSYRLMGAKGPEYVSIDRPVEVTPDGANRESLRLRRWINMSERGWHSGDCHLHYARPREELNERLRLWAQAEDLKMGNILRMGDGRRTYFEQYAFGKGGRFVYHKGAFVPGQEDPRTNILGHTISLNLNSPIRNVGRYYMYGDVFDTARRQGGISGYAHVNTDSFNVHRDMTLNIARGKVDFAEVCEFGKVNTDLYYEFLNLGFRLTAAGGSDVPWGGTVGDSRTYAYTGKEFDPDEWFEAFKQGRTFATAGPMLEFTVNGQRPGATLQLAKSQVLEIQAKGVVGSRGAVGLSRLEIVANGEVIHSADPDGGTAELNIELPVDRSMWIAARTQHAHTTPVYVTVSGQRHWNVSAAPDLLEKRLLHLDEIEKLIDQGQITDGMEPVWEAPDGFIHVREELREAVAEARAVYHGLQAQLQ